jgi:hypothetical protein
MKPLGALLALTFACSPACAASRPALEPARAPAVAASDADEAPRAPLLDVNTDRDLDTDARVVAEGRTLLPLVAELRRELARLGGKLTMERIDYALEAGSARAELRVKLLPGQLPAALEWIDAHAHILDEHVRSTAPNEYEIDAAVAREEVTARLRGIDARLAGDALSEPERRVLLEERMLLVGAAQPSAQFVAARMRRVSTLVIELVEPRAPTPWRDGKLVGALRGSALALGVLGGQPGARLGVGLAVGGLMPASPTLELIGYAADGADGRAGVQATIGLRTDARAWLARDWLVPFAGVRLGYAYLDRHAAVIAPELGLDLLRVSSLAWSVSVRPTALISGESQLAVEAGTTIGLVF